MKPIKNLQLWLIFFAFIVTLGILFGGQALTAKVRVDNPLKRDVYTIDGVKKFELLQDKEGIKVKLQLKKVENLQEVLDRVQQKVTLYYHKPVQEIQITDHSNQRLREVRYQLSFNLEEAVGSGRYVQLKAALESYSPIKSRVYFSRDYIYIQLEDGLNYHYEAFPRQLNGLNRAVAQGITGGDPVL